MAARHRAPDGFLQVGAAASDWVAAFANVTGDAPVALIAQGFAVGFQTSEEFLALWGIE